MVVQSNSSIFPSSSIVFERFQFYVHIACLCPCVSLDFGFIVVTFVSCTRSVCQPDDADTRREVGKRSLVDEASRMSDRVFPTVLATATLTTEIIAFGGKINRTNTARGGRTRKKCVIVRSKVATPTFFPR